MGALTGPLILIVAMIVAFGWLVLLVGGIVMARQGRQPAGTVMTVIGGAWGLGALLIAGFTVLAIVRAARSTEESAATFAEFNPAHYRGKLGTIVIPAHDQATLSLLSPGPGESGIRLHAVKGVFHAPPGHYRVAKFEVQARDRDLLTWTATSAFDDPPGRDITVTAGGQQQLDLGEPYTARVVPQMSGLQLSLDFKLTGKGGESVSLERHGSQVAPGFQVLDKAGKVLWSGQFEFG